MSDGVYFWRVQMFDADRNPGALIEGRFNLRFRIFLPMLLR